MKNKRRLAPLKKGILLMIAYLVVQAVVSSVLSIVLKTESQKVILDILLLIIGLLFVYGASKIIMKGKYDFGLRRQRFLTGLLVLVPAVLLIVDNIRRVIVIVGNGITMKACLLAVVNAWKPAINEEVLLRAFLLGCMMLQWKNKKNGIYSSLFVSALAFGLLHLLNLTMPDAIVLNVIVKAIYATAFGILFGAAFIRSHNLWTVVIVHYLVDITDFLLPGEEVMSAGDILFLMITSVICIVVGLRAVRKEKQAEILQIWDADTAVEE